jgi:hypothetical protein
VARHRGSRDAGAAKSDLLIAKIPLAWIGYATAGALVVGLLLILGGRDERQRRGLGEGRTLDLDDRTLQEQIPVSQPAAKCRACGMREGCGQRRGRLSFPTRYAHAS